MKFTYSKKISLFFLSTLIFFCGTEHLKAYPAFEANDDRVVVGPYDTSASGVGNWGSSSVNARDFFVYGQKYRIRQSGTITRVKLYTASTQDITGFYVMIWRKDGANYDLVGMSENLSSRLISGDFATIDLQTPISGVEEGDFYGARMEWSSPHLSFFARSGLSDVTSYFFNGQATSADFPWESKSTAVGSAMPIELYMTAPQAVFIGDSIIMGATSHTSYLSSTIESAPNTTIEKHLYDLTGYSYQNMGIGSQTTTGISGRFVADVINLKPRVVIADGGVNDIAGAGSKSTFLANWTSMLDAVQADSGIANIVILKILPWTNGTNTQMQTRDDWNSALTSLASSYSKAVVVDTSSYVGKFRSGGDSDNLWDIKTEYNDDGVHFNSAGHLQIATSIYDAIQSLPAKIVTLSPADNAEAVAVDANLVITFDNPVDVQGGSDNDIQIYRTSDNTVVETIDAQSQNVTGSGTAIITINPSSNLDPNLSYYIHIGSNAFKSRGAGNYVGIANDSTWNFRTVDTIGSSISSLSPQNNSTDVSVSGNLVLTFNESVVFGSGADNDIIIKKLSDNTVVETIDAQSQNVTGSGTAIITINPSSNLDPNTSYYVTIGSGAFRDESGNYFAGISNNGTWSFRTINYVGSYSKRKSITIRNTNITSALSNFPLFVKINSDSDIGNVVRNDGYDILFTDSSNNPLSYERESWSGGGGSSASGYFWVRTNLNQDNNVSTPDTIYIYYGKADSTDNQDVVDGSNDVWNSNFAGVWHLSENAVDEQSVAGKHLDSTINAKTGTQNGNVRVTGKVAYGQGFDGTDDNITIASPYSSQDISVSWWSNCGVVSPVAEGIFDINRSSDRLFAYNWNIGGQNGLYVAYRDQSTLTNYVRLLDSSITQSDWHHYVIVWNESAKTFTLYKDGTAQVATSSSNPTVPSGSNTRLGIGANATEGNVNIDEFRIASTTLTASWIKFEYENVANVGTELTFGSETANTEMTDSTAPSQVGIPTFGSVTSNSIEIIKPESVTENGSGLYEWQVRRNSSNELGYSGIGTDSFTDSSLIQNTLYTYDVNFKDQAFNVGSYGVSVSKYTLANTPTNLSFSSNSTSITISTSELPNINDGQSGYYFSRDGGGNSGWIKHNYWQDTNIYCGQTYYYSVKYRNADGVETSTFTLSRRNESCSSTGSSIRRHILSLKPTAALVQYPNTSPQVSSIFMKPLAFGSKSADVTRLQTLLAILPSIYPEGVVSGYYGPLTEKAVQRFQIQYGIVKSTKDPGYGYFGPKTRAKIADLFYRND